MGRRTCALLVAVGALHAPPALAQPVLTGQEVDAAARESIDVVSNHLTFLQAQAARRALLGYVNSTTRWALARFELNDGQRVGGNLTREQINIGLGLGSPELGVFAGANYDIVMVSGPAFTTTENFNPPLGGQIFGFVGLAVADVQLTYATQTDLLGTGSLGRDPWGSFQTDREADYGLRPGAPGVLAYPDTGADFTVLSAYEGRTGAFASLAWENEVTEVGESRKTLRSVRLNLQPLQNLPESIVSTVGIPTLGLRLLRAIEDHRGLRASEPRSPNASASPELPASRQIELGADDVLQGGLRWRVVQEVSPQFRLMAAEVGYVDEFGIGTSGLRVGAKGTVHRRSGGLEGAWDSYVLYNAVNQIAAGLFTAPLGFGVSYSYNTPDTATFFPIPNAHVFGIQAILGYPETSRPLVPLVRTVAELGKGGDRS